MGLQSQPKVKDLLKLQGFWHHLHKIKLIYNPYLVNFTILILQRIPTVRLHIFKVWGRLLSRGGFNVYCIPQTRFQFFLEYGTLISGQKLHLSNLQQEWQFLIYSKVVQLKICVSI